LPRRTRLSLRKATTMNLAHRHLNALAIATLAGLLVGAAAPVRAQSPDTTTSRPAMGHLNSHDIQWSTDAAQANRAEVMLGELAKQRTHNPAVLRFAQMMIDQHSAANNDLLAVLARKDRSLPESINDGQRALYTSLRRLHGPAFDSAYMNANVTAHREAARLYRMGTNADDSDVRRYARQTLPHVEMHLAMATEIQRRGFYAHRRSNNHWR